MEIVPGRKRAVRCAWTSIWFPNALTTGMAKRRPTAAHPVTPTLASGYQGKLRSLTQFIPDWVKVAVAVGTGPGHDDRLEAHRGERSVKKSARHISPMVRVRRLRSSLSPPSEAADQTRLAGEHYARPVFPHRRHHGRQRFRRPERHDAQYPAGVGVDPCRCV